MALQWNLIKEKYPKAFKPFHQWLKDTASADYWENFGKDLSDCDDRMLYDFFDEQGIYINILEAGILTGKIKDYTNFRWVMTTGFKTDRDAGKWESSSIYNHDYPLDKKVTRTEAEEQAFLKAFEILEDKL